MSLAFLVTDHIIWGITRQTNTQTKNQQKKSNNKQNYLFQLIWQIGQANEIQGEVSGRGFWEDSLRGVNAAGGYVPFGLFFSLLPAAWNLAIMVGVSASIV